MTQKTTQPPRLANQIVQNKILLRLTKKDRSKVLAKLEFLSLPVGTILNEAGKLIEYGYFVYSGLASVPSIAMKGRSVEVGLCGTAGFVGIPLIAGYKTSHTRVLMQVGGSGFRISIPDFVPVTKTCPLLARALQRFAQELALQASQTAACNRLHDLNERLARWLLMSQDRLGGVLVPLTQKFLAHDRHAASKCYRRGWCVAESRFDKKHAWGFGNQRSIKAY